MQTQEEYINLYIGIYDSCGLQGSGSGLGNKVKYLSRAGYTDNMSFLDYGCGCGFILDGINPTDYYGVDIVPYAVYSARLRHPRRKFDLFKIGKLQTEPRDFVAAISVFTHTRYEDVNDSLGDIYRNMKDDGRGMIDILEGNQPETPFIRYWDKEKFWLTLGVNGFRVIDIFHTIGKHEYNHTFFVVRKCSGNI